MLFMFVKIWKELKDVSVGNWQKSWVSIENPIEHNRLEYINDISSDKKDVPS